MRKIICLLILCFVTGVVSTSCVHQQAVVIEKKTPPPPQTYKRFMNALSRLDVGKVNSTLDFRCQFKQYPGMKGWYGFYREEKLMIGPFPLKNYRNSETLNLTRPAGYRENDYSRFHVFGQHYDLYFYFGPECVWIEGSGATGSKQARTYVY